MKTIVFVTSGSEMYATVYKQGDPKAMEHAVELASNHSELEESVVRELLKTTGKFVEEDYFEDGDWSVAVVDAKEGK